MSNSPNALSKYLGIFSKTPEEKILRLLIEMGAQIVGADEGSLLVFVEESGELEFAMTVGSNASEKTLVGQRVPLGKGITGLAAASHEVQIGAPTFKDIKQSEKRGNDPEAVMAAPMLMGESLIGVITAVSFQQGKRFNSKDAKLYAGFASIAAVVVEQQRRISKYEAVSIEDANTSVPHDGSDMEQVIINSITRLVRSKPHQLEKIAGLLSIIEELIS